MDGASAGVTGGAVSSAAWRPESVDAVATTAASAAALSAAATLSAAGVAAGRLLNSMVRDAQPQSVRPAKTTRETTLIGCFRSSDRRACPAYRQSGCDRRDCPGDRRDRR